ncbi:carboxypeptidase regulatory-like domain-containing protein [candidate division KSB1 bacterium]
MRKHILLIYILTLLLAVAGAFPASAQEEESGNASIYGFVKSGLDSTVIPNANVVLVGTPRGDATNEFGYYRITRMPAGRYIIEISVIGFRRFLREVILGPSDHVQIDAFLELEPIILEEISRTAEREVAAREIPISIQELSGLELRTATPTIGQPDVFRTLEMLPGVLTVSDFSSALYVRGGTPDQNLVLLDGAVIYNPFHLGGFFSTFNTSALSSAELMAGGFAAPYGGRVSSVLNVTTTPGDRDRWGGEANANFLSSSLFVQGPVPLGSLSLAARRSYMGYIDVINRQSIYQYKAPPYYFQDLQGKIELKPTRRNTISFSGYYDLDVLRDYEQTETNRRGGENVLDTFNLDIDWGNQAASFIWKYDISRLFHSRLIYAVSRFHTTIDMFDTQMDPDNILLKDTIENRSFRYEAVLKPTSFLQFRAGIERQEEEFNYDLLGLGRDMIHANRTPTTVSPYGDITLEYLNVLMVQVGLRQNRFELPEPSTPDFYTEVFPDYTHELRYFEPGEREQVEPRLGVRFRPSEKFIITAAAGIYHQNLYSLPLQGESSINLLDVWFPLDMKYEPIRARHIIGGIKYYLPEKFTFSVEAYHKKLDNILERRDFFYPWDPETYFMKGTGDVRGVDILLRRSTRSVYGWIGYTYAHTRGTFDNQTFNLRYDRRHSINFALHWFSWDRSWEATLNWTYGSGFPYSRIIGRYRVPAIIDYLGGEWYDGVNSSWKYEKGPKNGANYPAYHRMDIAIRRKIHLGPLEALVYLQIINVYNQTNTLFLRRSIATGSEVGNVRRVGMFPNIPSFGIEIKF